MLISKIGISRTFRNLHVNPPDCDLLDMKWNNNSYLDISFPMGLKMGSTLYQRVEVLHHILKSKKGDVYNYIDNVICIHRVHDTETEFDMASSFF